MIFGRCFRGYRTPRAFAAFVAVVLSVSVAGESARAADEAAELFTGAEKEILQGEQAEAVGKLRRVIARHRQTPFAPRAQLKLAELYAANREHAAAFDAAQEVIDKFPASDLFSEALEIQLRVVERVLDEYRQRRVRGDKSQRGLPKREAAREMLESMLKSGRFSPQAPRVQYRLAMALDEENNPADAVREFNTFVANYPEHHLADDAAFQAAFIDYRLAREKNRDRAPRERARLSLEEFLLVHPDSEKAPEARHLLTQLREWETEKLAEAGRFYERAVETTAGQLEYNDVLQQEPPGPPASGAAKARLDRINKSLGAVRPAGR